MRVTSTVWLMVVASAGVLAAPASSQIDRPAHELTYRFVLEGADEPGSAPERFARDEGGGALAVRIVLESRGADAGVTTFSVHDHWGGVDAGGQDITDLTAYDVDGGTLPVERQAPHRWRVSHPAGAAVTVHYRIRANEHQSQSDPGQHRRPILSAGLFHTVGYLGLVRPEHIPDDETLAVTLEWRGFQESGWTVASSFGAGPGKQRVEATLRELLGALYVAGDDGLRAHARPIRGGTLLVTLAGHDWRFDDEAFVRLAESIVVAERDFFDDHAKSFYWISVVPVGPITPHGSNLGGTGLTNCFALMLNPNASLAFPPRGMSVPELLAHEMFHEWNGKQIEREDPEELVYWFSEGFTDFYARRILARAGYLDREAFARSVNETVADYLLSPVRGEPNERVLADYWNDDSVQKLPYLRGDLVAMVVDRAILERTSGERSLDDLMRELLAAARRDDQRVSTELLLARIAEHAGEDVATRVADALAGGDLHLPPDLLAPCLEMTVEPVHPFDLGFDLQTSMDLGAVVDVRPDSPAARAGLRDGQALRGWSVHGGDADSEARFTIEDERGPRDVAYLPRGDTVPIPRFTVAEGAPGDCR